ncbi:hypothetical protein TRVA0_056S00738 [Trichomonascus vanleenenianus]|uniref:fungal specific transcription factor domain-containing protein n=1 Tax=Trichomonascus vanleenenianus TaxID=2268995 RepID=UPI003ECB1225
MEVIHTLIDAYFQYINPIVPIMDRNDVIQYLKEPPTDMTYALVAAMTAVPLRRVNSLQQKYIKSGLHETLIDEAVKTKNSLAYIRQNSPISIKVSFFLYLCFCATEEYDMAYYYLNESAMLAKLLRLDDERSYRGLSQEEAFSRRILYWGLYVSDRGFSIHERTPVIMTKKIMLPTVPKDGGNSYDQFTEFLTLVRVMVAMDDSFMDAWVSIDGISPTQFSSFYLPRIQQSLVGALTQAPERYESGVQKSNVLITQPWLLLLLWKASTNWPNRGTTQNQETNYLFPTMVAQVASEVTKSVTLQDLLSHGPGMRKKLFDIGVSLAETVTFMPELNFQGNYNRKQILSHIMTVSKQLGDTQSAEFKQLSRHVKSAIQELDTAGSTWIYSQTTVLNDPAASSESDNDVRANSDGISADNLLSPARSETLGSVTSTEKSPSLHSSLETHSAAPEFDYERNFLSPDSVLPLGAFMDVPQVEPTSPLPPPPAPPLPPPAASQATEITFYHPQSPHHAPLASPSTPPAAQLAYYPPYAEGVSHDFSPIASAVLEGSSTQLAEPYGYRPA